MEDLTVRGDDFKGADGRREVAVMDSRPVSRGGDGTRDRDVRQRRQVVERVALRQ